MKTIVMCAAFFVPSAAASAGDSAMEQLVKGAGVEAASVAAPVVAAKSIMADRDIFKRVDACSVVDAVFFNLPSFEGALSMLQPCMEALSTGGVSISAEKGKFYSRPYVQGFEDEIRIVVTGSAATNSIVRELEAALAARDGRLLTYRAKVVNQLKTGSFPYPYS